MGYFRHHAILVTSMFPDAIEQVYAAVHALLVGECDFLEVSMISPLSPPTTNGYKSFTIYPDGSKEGWETSDEGDEVRNTVVGLLTSNHFHVSWCHVQYGDEEGDNKMLAHNDGDWES